MSVRNSFLKWFKDLDDIDQRDLLLFLEDQFIQGNNKLFTEALNIGSAPILKVQKALTGFGVAPMRAQSKICNQCGRPL
jgi:hypothetical protein